MKITVGLIGVQMDTSKIDDIMMEDRGKGQVEILMLAISDLKSADQHGLHIVTIDLDKFTDQDVQLLKTLRSRLLKTHWFVCSSEKLNPFYWSCELHPTAFIQKPIDPKLLAGHIRFVMSVMAQEMDKLSIETDTRIIIQLPVESIYYFKSCGNHKTIVVTEKQQYTTSEALAEIERRVQKCSDLFVIPLRGYLINIKHVVEIENDTIQMRDLTQIKVARGKLRTIRTCVIKHYTERTGD